MQSRPQNEDEPADWLLVLWLMSWLKGLPQIAWCLKRVTQRLATGQSATKGEKRNLNAPQQSLVMKPPFPVKIRLNLNIHHSSITNCTFEFLYLPLQPDCGRILSSTDLWPTSLKSHLLHTLHISRDFDMNMQIAQDQWLIFPKLFEKESMEYKNEIWLLLHHLCFRSASPTTILDNVELVCFPGSFARLKLWSFLHFLWYPAGEQKSPTDEVCSYTPQHCHLTFFR